MFLGFPCGSAGKEFACNVGDIGSIPGLGRSPGEGKGYPFPYSGLENSIDYIVHGVVKSWTQLSNFHFPFHACRSRGLSISVWPISSKPLTERAWQFLPEYELSDDGCFLARSLPVSWIASWFLPNGTDVPDQINLCCMWTVLFAGKWVHSPPTGPTWTTFATKMSRLFCVCANEPWKLCFLFSFPASWRCTLFCTKLLHCAHISRER